MLDVIISRAPVAIHFNKFSISHEKYNLKTEDCSSSENKHIKNRNIAAQYMEKRPTPLHPMTGWTYTTHMQTSTIQFVHS